jgi:hypothetical protein
MLQLQLHSIRMSGGPARPKTMSLRAPRTAPASKLLARPSSLPSSSFGASLGPSTSSQPVSCRLSGAPLHQSPAAEPTSPLSHHDHEYSPQVEALYEEALAYARANQLAAAREAFKQLTHTYPELCKVWVSWAQVRLDLPLAAHKIILFLLLPNPSTLLKHILCPDHAQMEKRTQGELRFARCRDILHRGLLFNMESACLVQVSMESQGEEFMEWWLDLGFSAASHPP